MANQQQAPGTGAFDPAHIARSAWSDQEIFDREMSRIFRRTWVFVAHESEIASPGDYVTRRIGLDPVIVVRLDDGSIGVHLNACAHRGTQLCNATRGNTSHFRCPYHGWTYNTRGQLRGVPMLRKVYGQLDKGALSLRQARVEVHGGLVFATWASDGVSLEQFLAGAAWYLDALLLAPPEGWETGGPPQRYIAPGNWKLGADNYSGDSYHVDYTHKTALDAGFFEDTGAAEWHSLHVATEQGHGLRVALLDGPESFWFPGFPDDVQRRLSESLGDDHRELMDRVETIHGTLFPNLSFIYLTFAHTGDADEQTTAVMHVRQWQPVDADTHEVLSFMLVPRHAPADFKRRSVLIGYRTLGGAAAYFEGDDIHNFTSIRQGLRGAVGRSAASDFSMGTRLAGHSDTGQDGSSVTRQVHDEANQRAFYTAWHALMAEDD